MYVCLITWFSHCRAGFVSFHFFSEFIEVLLLLQLLYYRTECIGDDEHHDEEAEEEDDQCGQDVPDVPPGDALVPRQLDLQLRGAA